MKKSTQISSLPIISIADGNQVGKVKSLVINPDKGSVDFLTIEHEDFQVSVKAIPFKKVVGIGEFAVTVDSESAVIDLNEIPIANQLVNKKIKITNTKVMTRKGELIGEVIEYFVDQDTGNILGMQLKVADKEVALSSDSVVTFGKDIIIVNEDAASHFLNSVEELDGTAPELVEELTSTVEDEEVRALKEKQIELLSGKTLTKDVYDKNGNVLFYEGTILTPEHVERAQQEGPSIVVELSMNVEA
ncbi:photosystem reaction center subunit H [Robertmurraya yapensis]|uniref:Photosystem reaction center subunit H n=1 Tax=Bacillus yapensis TaxID=2492960 RepID=A0A431VVR6_9BACI|nr:PRC-barrel domain-containing protein [Bacillus yapensis]RTR27326.1 photosystem reaction center subunit H [Bacillus yapensis]TKS94046.1 photosystem reaction center subunit H [Bacillus yapensis]